MAIAPRKHDIRGDVDQAGAAGSRRLSNLAAAVDDRAPIVFAIGQVDDRLRLPFADHRQHPLAVADIEQPGARRNDFESLRTNTVLEMTPQTDQLPR